MDAIKQSDTTAEYGMVESCAANYDKREGQPEYTAGRSVHHALGENGGRKSGVDEYEQHCCIL